MIASGLGVRADGACNHRPTSPAQTNQQACPQALPALSLTHAFSLSLHCLPVTLNLVAVCAETRTFESLSLKVTLDAAEPPPIFNSGVRLPGALPTLMEVITLLTSPYKEHKLG